jgi:hypothetical protein
MLPGKSKRSQEQLKLNGTYQLQVHANFLNLFGKKNYKFKKKGSTIFFDSKAVV